MQYVIYEKSIDCMLFLAFIVLSFVCIAILIFRITIGVAHFRNMFQGADVSDMISLVQECLLDTAGSEFRRA